MGLSNRDNASHASLHGWHVFFVNDKRRDAGYISVIDNEHRPEGMMRMRKIYQDGRYEVWAQYDRSAKIWELYADSDGCGYGGCCDTLEEAKKLAKAYVKEQKEER